MLRRSILIFHAGALGDFILTWPLALALGRLFAQSRVIYVVGTDKGKLAERVARVEAVDSEAGWHHLFGDASKLPETSQRLLTGAQMVVSFIGRADDVWTANVKRFAGEAPVISLSMSPGQANQRHITHHLAEQLIETPIIQQAVVQLLRSINDRGIGSRTGGKDVVLHPGAGSRSKRWPIEKFVSLAIRLREVGISSRFVIGEVEREHFTEADIQRLSAQSSLHFCATLLNLHDHLATAGAFVGNDSGPGHLAGIIGVPTLSLFGPTDPAIWQPLGPRVTVIRASSTDEIELTEVFHATREKLQNRPVL